MRNHGQWLFFLAAGTLLISGVAVAQITAEEQAAAAHFAALPQQERDASFAKVAKGLLTPDQAGNEVDSWGMGVRSPLLPAAVASVTAYVEPLAPSGDPQRNLSWAHGMAVNAVLASQWNGRPLAALNSPRPDNAEAEASGEAEARRRDIRKLLMALLRHPQTSEQAFYILSGCQQGLRISALELDDFAAAALHQRLRFSGWPRFSPAPKLDPGLWTRFKSDGSPVAGAGLTNGTMLEMYLAESLSHGKVPPLLVPDNPASLTDHDLKEADPDAQICRSLLKVAQSPGIAAFQKWRNDPAIVDQNRRSQGRALMLFIALAGRQDLFVEMEHFVCELLHVSDPQQPGDGATLVPWLVLYRRTWQEREQAITRIATQLLGPEETWPKPPADRGAGAGRMQLGSLLSFLTLNPAGFVARQRFVEDHALSQDITVYTGESSFKYLPMVPMKLLGSGIFANDAAILPLRCEMLRQFMQRPSQDGLAELMEVKGEERMWARLSAAAISKDPALAARTLEENAAAIAKWPEPQRQKFSALVAEFFPGAARR